MARRSKQGSPGHGWRPRRGSGAWWGMLIAGGAALAVGGWLLALAPAGKEGSPVEAPPAAGKTAVGGVERLRVKVLATHPHDPAAYTQGLLWHRGALYESTGRYGESSLRRWQPGRGEVLQRRDLAPELFGEGLALAGGRLIQLTWLSGRALLWDLESFEPAGELAYEGEGWGLCFDGHRLVMSDGSHLLSFRDPETFALAEQVAVTLEGKPLTGLNELECARGEVYANVYTTDWIVRIDPATGQVRALIDAGGLLSPAEAARAEVLNGIAWRPETDTFLITGKLWPHVFEVRWEP